MAPVSSSTQRLVPIRPSPLKSAMVSLPDNIVITPVVSCSGAMTVKIGAKRKLSENIAGGSHELKCKRLNTGGGGGGGGTTGNKSSQASTMGRRNARERNRVKQVNNSFLTLRQHVPGAAKAKKISKVETLKQATEYIRNLQRILDEHDAMLSQADVLNNVGAVSVKDVTSNVIPTLYTQQNPVYTTSVLQPLQLQQQQYPDTNDQQSPTVYSNFYYSENVSPVSETVYPLNIKSNNANSLLNQTVFKSEPQTPISNSLPEQTSFNAAVPTTISNSLPEQASFNAAVPTTISNSLPEQASFNVIPTLISNSLPEKASFQAGIPSHFSDSSPQQASYKNVPTIPNCLPLQISYKAEIAHTANLDSEVPHLSPFEASVPHLPSLKAEVNFLPKASCHNTTADVPISVTFTNAPITPITPVSQYSFSLSLGQQSPYSTVVSSNVYPTPVTDSPPNSVSAHSPNSSVAYSPNSLATSPGCSPSTDSHFSPRFEDRKPSFVKARNFIIPESELPYCLPPGVTSFDIEKATATTKADLELLEAIALWQDC